MYKIYHVFSINGLPGDIFPLIGTTEGLRRWWTSTITGDASEEGGSVTLVFGENGSVTMKVLRIIRDESILWTCVSSTFERGEAWDGTEISIHLNPEDGHTIVRFEHENWKEEDDYFARCNYTWAHYLKSLKNVCEIGQGEPFLA